MDTHDSYLSQNQDADQTSAVVASFDQILESGNLVDTFSQVGEFAIDQAIKNDLLKDIPLFGLLVSGYKTVVNVKDFRLTRKVYRFLYSLQDTTAEQRHKFVKKYVEANQEDTASSLLDILEKLNNSNSVPLICNLMKAVINDELTAAQFNRLVIAIQRTAFTDLTQLSKYVNDYDEDGLSDALQAAGLIYQSVYDGGNADTGESNSKFKASPNGYLLLKYGFMKNDVEETPRLAGINAGLIWEEIDDIADEDKAQAERDLYRGK